MKQLLLTLLFFFSLVTFGQVYTVNGLVMDESNSVVEAMVCMLKRASDGQAVKTVVTNDDGKFLFTDIPAGSYKMAFQHLAFEHDDIDVTIEKNTDLEAIVVFAKHMELKGVEIKGEHPVVKAKDGKLVYNAPRLINGKTVTNAFETLKNVPNIMGNGDNITLVGTDKFVILLNGKPTNLSMTQMIQVLKGMPAAKVKDIEIMYSAPPQYNVRGAAINIILDQNNVSGKSNIPEFQGEGNLNYRQATYGTYGARANLVYNKPSFTADLILGGMGWKMKGHNEMHAIHQMKDNSYDISQLNRSRKHGTDLNTRLALDYSFKNKNSLNFTYTGEYNTYKSKSNSNAAYLENNNPFTDIDSYRNDDGDDQLHNLKLDYITHKSFKAGIDYTFYRDPSNTKYGDSENATKLDSYKTKTEQKIDKAMLYANHETEFGKGWKLSYGGNFSFSKNNNDYDYFDIVSATKADSTSLTRQKEYNGSVFVGFSKSFTSKFSSQVSVSGNYFNATIDNTTESKKTLWNEFKPFFNANLSYVFSPQHILQGSFSTDVSYPQYWALSPNATQLNSYSVVMGNPELKFSTSYSTQLVYIFKSKYMLVGSYKYYSDYFIQLPKQSSENLQNVFQMVNLDYRKIFSLTVIVPFKLANIWENKMTLLYQRTEDKDSDFYTISYKKSKNTIMFSTTNTINVSSKPNIKLDISTFVMNGFVQGSYDIHHMSNIDAGVKWSFLNNGADLIAKVEDIFRNGSPNTSINQANQWSRMTVKVDAPVFKLSFIYRFGEYKVKKKTKDVDKSRFGQGG